MRKVMLVLVISLLGLGGCASVTSTPAANTITELNEVDFDQEMKRGESCARGFLFFGPFGNATVESAMSAGDIEDLKYVDNSQSKVIGVTSFCTIAYGD